MRGKNKKRNMRKRQKRQQNQLLPIKNPEKRAGKDLSVLGDTCCTPWAN
jgi:hypothetical protein